VGILFWPGERGEKKRGLDQREECGGGDLEDTAGVATKAPFDERRRT